MDTQELVDLSNIKPDADKFGGAVSETTRKNREAMRAVREAGLRPSKQFQTMEAALDYAHELAAIVGPLGGSAQVYSLQFI